ncbi:adenylate kinase family protein [Nocardioides endophyticus]|uniref:adenylate kinase family protein n=1 Tax=Nocardioides endophyticus TaxID=1353775 RepID=UPI0031E7DEF4
MGPPGAGKGTQAAALSRELAFSAISTGDIFMRNVAESTHLGREARTFLDSGEYVPDSLTNRMVRARLQEADARDGFLLDEYPRTLAQVEELDIMLSSLGVGIDVVVALSVDLGSIVNRLRQRSATEGPHRRHGGGDSSPTCPVRSGDRPTCRHLPNACARGRGRWCGRAVRRDQTDSCPRARTAIRRREHQGRRQTRQLMPRI